MDFEWDPAKSGINRRKLGRDSLDRVLVVSWTWNEDNIRLIMARRATPRERRQYAEDADA